MLNRYDIINHTIQRYFNDECKYLEIGVADPRTCFDRIIASNKTSVDPDPNYKYDYNMNSDEFFDGLGAGLLNFDKDHKWYMGSAGMRVPDVEDLRWTARDLLTKAAYDKDNTSNVGTGGFMAYKLSWGMQLTFQLFWS